MRFVRRSKIRFNFLSAFHLAHVPMFKRLMTDVVQCTTIDQLCFLQNIATHHTGFSKVIHVELAIDAIHLRFHDQQWLLILDNVEDIKNVFPLARASAILLTTRRQLLQPHAHNITIASAPVALLPL